MVRTKKIIKVVRMSGKYDILIVQETKHAQRGNVTERNFEMTQRKSYQKARHLNATNMCMKKIIEK